MEIFIATSNKSFDLNPTHPGPLPRDSFHTSATEQIERSESKAARGDWQAASDMSQGPRVAASFCAQGARKLRPLRSAS